MLVGICDLDGCSDCYLIVWVANNQWHRMRLRRTGCSVTPTSLNIMRSPMCFMFILPPPIPISSAIMLIIMRIMKSFQILSITKRWHSSHFLEYLRLDIGKLLCLLMKRLILMGTRHSRRLSETFRLLLTFTSPNGTIVALFSWLVIVKEQSIWPIWSKSTFRILIMHPNCNQN